VVGARERIPEVPEKVYLFRSCTGSLEYPGTENAVRAVLARLGVETVMDPDQTCCSGYLLTCSAYLPPVSLAATARNLALAEARGLDTYTFCNGCFGYISELSHILLHHRDYLEMTNRLLAPMGYQYQGRSGVYHVQELYYRLKERIPALVTRPLRGLRVGVHYGCHYLARKYGVLDDGDLPRFHEELITLLGGTPVFYKERRMCCGYAVGRGFTHPDEVVRPHLARKLRSAQEEGVELITSVCPGCNVALDREQPRLRERGLGDFAIPVVDLAQLIALSFGVPVASLAFEANTVSLAPVLRKVLPEEEG
jgi:heterodisulfide reductase subunit B